MTAANEAAHVARKAKEPFRLKLVAFVLLLAPLWAILMALATVMLPTDLVQTASWQLLFPILPAALIALLLVCASSIEIAAISVALVWVAGLALLLGVQWWSREDETPHSRAETTAPNGPVPTVTAKPQPAPAPVPARPAAVPPQDFPEFPWPPPAASASYVLPRNLLDAKATVGQVSDAIIAALEHNGYVERSFFRTGDDGVALVTRLERINDDGTPLKDDKRWPGALKSQSSALDLAALLRGLFYVDRGRYRVIVFILQDRPFSQSAKQATEAESRAWLRTGANVLPREVAERTFADGSCTALIYEFASEGTAVRVVESPLTGRQHLEKSGVLAVLEKPK